jgi:hypothetical protein
MAHQRDIAYPAKEFGKGPVASQIPIVKGSDPVTGCLFVPLPYKGIEVQPARRYFARKRPDRCLGQYSMRPTI